MISERMFETMMHMIGYGNLTENFIDALHYCDHDSLMELASWCENRWMNPGQLTIPLLAAIDRYIKEE